MTASSSSAEFRPTPAGPARGPPAQTRDHSIPNFRAEDGVRHTYRRQNCGWVVHAHDVRAAQNGRDYGCGVAGRRRAEVL